MRRKSLIILFSFMIGMSTISFAAPKAKPKLSGVPVFKQISAADIDVSKMYEVDGTGKNTGKKVLKGFPGASNCIIAYTGNYDSYQASVEIINKSYSNVNEKVRWTDLSGKKKFTKRGQFYAYLDAMVPALDAVRDPNEFKYSQEWFHKKYGKLYDDWMTLGTDIDEGERLLDYYMRSISPYPEIDRTWVSDVHMNDSDDKSYLDLDGIN